MALNLTQLRVSDCMPEEAQSVVEITLPVPPEEAAQNILPFLNQDGDAVSTSESSFEPEWD